MSVKVDSQVVEIRGRNRLVDELLAAGVEVALPLRDHGIDLLAYVDTGTDVKEFAAVPIQMKAASAENFVIDQKYEKFPGIVLAYVWHVGDAAQAATYALTYTEAEELVKEMGWAKTRSWQELGGWSTSYVGANLRDLLKKHRMTPERWRGKVMQAASLVREGRESA